MGLNKSNKGHNMAQKVDKKEIGRILSGGETDGAKWWRSWWGDDDKKKKQEKQQEAQEAKRPRAEAELPTTRY